MKWIWIKCSDRFNSSVYLLTGRNDKEKPNKATKKKVKKNKRKDGGVEGIMTYPPALSIALSTQRVVDGIVIVDILASQDARSAIEKSLLSCFTYENH